MAHERYVHRVGEALVDTRFGEFRLIAYESEIDGGESHVALVWIGTLVQPCGDNVGSRHCSWHARNDGCDQALLL